MSEPNPSHHEPETTAHENPSALPGKSPITPVAAMMIVVVALLLVVVLMKLRKDDPEVVRLQAEVAELSKGNQARGLPALDDGRSMSEVASRLKKETDDLVALAERYRSEIEANNLEALKIKADLVSSEQYRQIAGDEIDRLKKDIRNGRDASYELLKAREELASLKAEDAEQKKEIDALRKELENTAGMASKDELDSLEKRLEEARRERDYFKALSQQAQEKLFASSENELLPQALELFRTLRALENKSDLDISKAYSNIGINLKASVVGKNLNFPTGSAQLAAADVAATQALVNEVPDGDLLLVIGYASETGNVDANRTLSSDRAKGVAELLTSVKRPGQKIQAVYMGQTDRFGSKFPENNQCCEIWHVRCQ